MPTYVDVDGGGGPVTLYPVEVTFDTGRSRKVSKRYSDVLNFHTTLLKAAPHVALETFNFPHKSIFSTSAEFTKERRRSGFEECRRRPRPFFARPPRKKKRYFELLLRLGSAYAPFVATFLRHGELKDEAPSFEELGSAGEAAAGDLAAVAAAAGTPTAKRLHSLMLDALDGDAESAPALALERPKSAFHWFVGFYLPAYLLAFAYAHLLTALGAITARDWDRGPVWLAVATAPLVLCVSLALLAPVCDDDLEF